MRFLLIACLITLAPFAAADELDGYLSSKPAVDKVVAESAGGVHADKRAADPDANPLHCSTCTSQSPSDNGLADPTLGARRKMHVGSGNPEPSSGPRGGTTTPSSVTVKSEKSDGVAGQGDFPPFISKLKFRVYDSLKALPEHSGPHGILRFSGPTDAYAVRFQSSPGGNTDGASGVAGLGQMPQAWADDSCSGWFWFSEQPGGAPVGENCKEGPIGAGWSDRGGGLSITYFVLAKGASEKSLGLNPCVLQPGKKYYFNVATSGWERTTEVPTRCDTGLASPLGDQNFQPD